MTCLELDMTLSAKIRNPIHHVHEAAFPTRPTSRLKYVASPTCSQFCGSIFLSYCLCVKILSRPLLWEKELSAFIDQCRMPVTFSSH